MKTVVKKRTQSLKQPLRGLKRNRITTMMMNLKINGKEQSALWGLSEVDRSGQPQIREQRRIVEDISSLRSLQLA